jgi:hypothetical protein
MKVWVLIVALLIGLTIVGCGLSIVGGILHWGGRAVDVVSQQVDPFELQRKYELFKDEAAALQSKLATLQMYKKRNDIGCANQRDRVILEQCNVWLQETLGVAASYNDLAKDYNSQMAKWNYAFCNVGSLPKGATEPLPREFAPYLTE